MMRYLVALSSFSVVFLTVGCVAFGNDPVVDAAEEYGVFPFHIPGEFNNVTVIAHLFLKCVKASRGEVEVHGVLSIEEAARVVLVHSEHLNQPVFYGLGPVVDLLDIDRKPVATMKGRKPIKSTEPWFVRAVLPKAAFENVTYISFNRGDHIAVIGRHLQRSCWTPSTAPPKAAIVLPATFGVPMNVLARLISAHIEWHVKFGFSHGVLYVRGLESDIFYDEAIRRIWSQGCIVFVRWSSLESGITLPNFEAYKGTQTVKYDQVVVYNHHLLASWGTAVKWLFIIDIDEFFFSPASTNVIELLTNGCLSGLNHNVKLKRYFTLCDGCDRKKPELDMWMQNSGPSFADHYSKMSRCTSCKHHKLVDTWDYKSISNNEVVRQYHVHWGEIAEELVDGMEMRNGTADDSCAVTVHFFLLFTNATYRSDLADGRWDVDQVYQYLNDGGNGFTTLPLAPPGEEDIF